MAIPVLAGIPWLAGVLGGLFASLVGWLAQFVTKRLAVVAAAVTVLIGLTTAFFAALDALISGLVGVMPSGMAAFWGHFAPTNLDLCLSAFLAANATRWVYDWNTRVVQMKLF